MSYKQKPENLDANLDLIATPLARSQPQDYPNFEKYATVFDYVLCEDRDDYARRPRPGNVVAARVVAAGNVVAASHRSETSLRPSLSTRARVVTYYPVSGWEYCKHCHVQSRTVRWY
jgi:hypothetical protein